MKRNRFAKIVATLGLTSSDPEVIEQLFLTGVDVFRLNFSHGSHDNHAQNIQTLRALERKHERPIAILQDLQGPKFRVGRFENESIELAFEQTFIFDQCEDLGNTERVYLPHPEVFQSAKTGDRLLLDDARVAFQVINNDGQRITAKHVYGKKLSNNKGLNLPDTDLLVSAMTEKDHQDLQFGLDQGVDIVALSFVQRAGDMNKLRDLVGGKAAILAKIEKPSAVRHISDILSASDAIMLARGDLGVEFPPEALPSIQKTVIEAARRAGKPIIVATQMLESMIDSPVPTRAEATDVDTAVALGADAVMLSGETAIGKYPVEAVSFMDRMIRSTEKDSRYIKDMRIIEDIEVKSSNGAVSHAVKAISNAINVSAIACYTASGSSAVRLCRERALTPIIALTPNLQVARRLQLYWGVDAVVMPDADRVQTIVANAANLVKRKAYGEDGDLVVVTAGVPFGQPGTTNTIRLATIGEDDSANIVA